MSTAEQQVGRSRWARYSVRRWSLGGLLGLALTLPVLLPLGYLVWLATGVGLGELLAGLERADVPWLCVRMMGIATGASAVALVIGAPWAWLAARTDVQGAGVFRWLGPLPLAIPPYVGALVYALLLAPSGVLHAGVAGALGRPTWETPFPGLIYGPVGSALVLGIFTSPYVFLNVYGALQRMDPAMEDAARSLGSAPASVLLHITLPLLRPALLAGGLLVFVYAWVDFGVVSLLRTRTFTTVLFTYLRAGFSLPAAAGLSLVLVTIVWALLYGQHRLLGRASYTQGRGTRRTTRRANLGRGRPVALAYLILVSTLTLFVPLGALLFQAARLGSPAELAAFVWSALPYVWHSLQVAVIGSLLSLAVGGYVAWRTWRGRDGALAGAILQAGYAAPATVIGLSVVGLSLSLFPAVYDHPLLLLPLAYVILFAAPTLQGVRAALAQVPCSMEEAVRALGYGPLTAARRVVIPLAWPGAASAWLLTFILSLRELAATIILRPAGFDTLPVRIWTHSTEVGLDPRASVLALILVTLVGAGWSILLFGRQSDARRNRTPLQSQPTDVRFGDTVRTGSSHR